MLFCPESMAKRREEIIRAGAKGDISEAEAGKRLIELDPEFGIGYLALGNARLSNGDREGADPYLWQAAVRRPCDHAVYFSLAERYSETDPDMAHWVSVLGFWKLAFYAEIPTGVAEGIGAIEELQGRDASDPATHERFAESLEADASAGGWPKRLAPYRILNEIQRHQDSGLDPDLVAEIRESAEECRAVFYGALRQWADQGPEVVSNAVAGLLFALIGEIGGPELIPEFLQVSGYPDFGVLSHAFWAIWRLGRRFPEAAFALLRELGAKARSGFRATLAEQIYLLPEIAGKRQAILALLDGFSEVAKEEDGAYLLLTVSTLVAMLGAAGESLSILQRHDRQLTKEGRRWIQEALDSDEAFVPGILAAELDELDIEAVCVDLELMGEDDEPDDEEFEEGEFEDEFEHEEVEAAPKPGRNDPCWCGSGKKYKKCHLAADEEAERSGAGRDGLTDPDEIIGATWQDLMERTSDWHRQDEALTAMELFFGDVPRELGTDDLTDSGFFEWYLLDYRPKSTGRTLVEEYLRRRGPRLDDAQRELLESWRDLRYGLWEVQRIEKGRGAEIKDVFSGDSLFVADVSLSNTGSQWDCLISRIHRWQDEWLFAGNGLLVPRGHLDALRERVETGSREAGMPAAEYFRSRAYEWRRVITEMAEQFQKSLKIVNFEGDPLEFCAAEYEMSDEDKVLSALVKAREFEETKEAGSAGRVFAWLDTGKKAKDSRRSYGRIEMRDGVLRLECNSRARLTKGKLLVEKHAGKWLRHRKDTFESLDDARRRAEESPEPKPTAPIDPELEREIILKYKAKHYETWPDEPLPALGGRTPREAVRSREGKAAVEALLRDFENTEDRERQRGKPAFDFSGLRKTLGL